MTVPLEFRLAGPADVAEVVGLLTEAAAWARDRGIERWWPIPFPERIVRRGVERGEVFLVHRTDELVGTIALAREDPLMWGDQPPVAGYVHRLAVRRSLAGAGLGRAILEWADGEVRRWGRSKLRLDCLATNAALRRYYLGLGFREVGTVSGKYPGEDRSSALLERDIA